MKLAAKLSRSKIDCFRVGLQAGQEYSAAKRSISPSPKNNVLHGFCAGVAERVAFFSTAFPSPITVAGRKIAAEPVLQLAASA